MTPEDFGRRMAMLNEARKAPKIDDDHEIFAMITSYKCKFLEIGDVFPLKKYRFEDTEFFGPAKAEIILRNIYGDFMKFPPIEERIGHYSSVEFL